MTGRTSTQIARLDEHDAAHEVLLGEGPSILRYVRPPRRRTFSSRTQVAEGNAA